MLPPSALPLDLLNNAVTAFSTLEDLIRYLEPDRWQLDLEDLYRPTWQLLGKAFVFGRKSRGKFSLQIRTSFNFFSNFSVLDSSTIASKELSLKSFHDICK